MARAKKKPPADETPKPEPPPPNNWRAQRYEVVPIDSIAPRGADEDPNRGDEEALDESIQENGFYGVVLVRAADRKIIAGKTRWGQLRADGETECPVIWMDVAPERADAINIADNQTRAHATTKQSVLADMLARLPSRKGLGIRGPDVQSLLEMARPKLGFLESMRREEAEAAAEREAEESDEPTGDDPEDDADEREPGDEDFENEEAAGPPDADDASEGDIPDFSPVRNMDAPRFPIPLVVSRRTLDRWSEYKKRVGERRDRDAFEVLLAAAMNTDPPGDA